MLLRQIFSKTTLVKFRITQYSLLVDARSVSQIARTIAIGRLSKGSKLVVYSKPIILKNSILTRARQLINWNVSVNFTNNLKQALNMDSDSTPAQSNNTESYIPDLLKHVRGMKDLSRDDFKCNVQVPSILAPFRSMKKLQQRKGDIVAFRRRGIKPLVDLPEDDPLRKTHKRILLDPCHHTSPESLPQSELSDLDVDVESWRMIDVELGYENFTHSEVLKAVLPEESDGVAGFSQAGHIVHVNLRDEVLDYKTIIGQVLLDKVSQAKTVVNKANIINNEFRNFQVELIAGEENYVTEVRRNNMTFEFDFSKVFWNSRLDTEHRRIYDLLNPGNTVFDMFAGVGPFSIPAGKKKCRVFANDINPESHKWLAHNAARNKVKDLVQAYNKDGRDFARDVIKPELLKIWQSEELARTVKEVHIVMNLPALAVEFLDAFPGLMSDVNTKDVHFIAPKVHCYSFSKCEDTKTDVKRAAEHVLGCELPDCESRIVRNVAPKKDMVYISFALTQTLLTGDGLREPERKRQKISEGDETSTEQGS